MKKKTEKFLSLLLVFSMVVSLLPALSSGAWADSPVAIVNGKYYDNFNVAWVIAGGGGGTMTLLADWDSKSHGAIQLGQGVNLTLNLNGHIIDRGIASTGSGNSTGDGEVFTVWGNSNLTINGGSGYTHKGRSDGGIWFWDETNGDKVNYTTGVIAGGNSTNGAGGIHIKSGATVTLNGVALAGNISKEGGGAVQLDGDSSKLIVNGDSHIEYNKAEAANGGAIYVGNGRCEITSGSSISHNTAEYGGAIYVNKNVEHAIYVHGTESTDGTKSVQFTDNSASVGGGAIHVEYGEKSAIYNAQFTGNRAGSQGGAIFVNDDYLAVGSCNFDGNRATDYGGAIYVNNEYFDLSGSNITGNMAHKGGGVYFDDDNPSISDCTITGNYASICAGGLYLDTDADNYSLKMSGLMVVKDNWLGGISSGINSNVYIESKDNLIIDTLGVGSSVGISIPGTPSSYNGSGNPFCKKATNAKADYFFSDDARYHIERQSDPTAGNYRYLYFASGAASKPTAQNVAAGTTDKTKKYNGYTLQRGYFQYPSVVGSDDKTSVYYYSDGFFAQEPTTYSSSLATMSLDLAMSAFGANANENTTATEDELKKNPNLHYVNKFCHVTQLLADIGCANENIYVNDFFTQKPGTDSIGVAIGQKALKDASGNDTDTILVPIAIRGAGYESEWASNVTLGKSGESQGFASAATQVMTEVEDYIRKYGLTDKIAAGKVKFWVVGYSRAGATANLTSKRLVDEYGTISATQKNANQIYGYDFEAPQGGEIGCNIAKYYCIHNIINKTDLVPRVAPSKMGFIRYGIDHYVPGAAGNSSPRTSDVLDSNNLVDNTAWNKDYTKGSDYMKQRTAMLSQLRAINPDIQFEDYFHTATFNFLSTGTMEWLGIGWDLVTETEDGTDASNWIDNFFSDLQKWSLNSNSANTATTDTGKNNTDYRRFYSTDKEPDQILRSGSSLAKDVKVSFQDAIAVIVPIVFGSDYETKQKLSQSLFGFSMRLDKQGLWDDVFGDLYTISISKYDGWINYFWNMLMEDPTGSAKAMGYKSIKDCFSPEQYEQLKAAWPTLIGVAFDFLNDDYNIKKTNKSRSGYIATLYYNLDTIAEAHYPEINLAWLRTYDSLYNDETTLYAITAPESVAVPTAKIDATAITAGASATTYSGDQTLLLSAPAGAAIYYTVKTTADSVTTTTDPQLYRQGVSLTAKSASDTVYAVTAYSMQYGVKSSEVTFNITIHNDRHSVTVNTGDPSKAETPTQHRAGEAVTIDAITPDGEVFDKWTTEYSGADKPTLPTTAVGTFTMPDSDITVTASYVDKKATVALTGVTPTGGSDFATKATCTDLTGINAAPGIVWTDAAGNKVSGKAAYNTAYTATITLTKDTANKIEFASGVTATVADTTNVTSTFSPIDGSVVVVAQFAPTAKAKLTAQPANPAGISVYTGHTFDEVAAMLPSTIAISTEDGTKMASVTWSCANFNGSDTKEYTFTGALDLTSLNVEAAGSYTGSISTTVTVQAREKAAVPTVTSGNPATSQTAQTIKLATATAGATIKYTLTTNSSTPGSEEIYPDAGITLAAPAEGITNVYTITAYSVPTNGASMDDSSKATFTYIISTPMPKYTVSFTASDTGYYDAGATPWTETRSADYTEGSTVTITAPQDNADFADEVFDHWENGESTNVITNENKSNRTLTINNLSGPVNLKAIYNPVVKEIVLSLDAPVAGAALDSSVNSANVTVTKDHDITALMAPITWSPATAGTAAYNTIYTATMKLSDDIASRLKFYFADNCTVSVNSGKVSGTLAQNSSGAAIYVTFPQTDPAKLLRVTQPADISVAYGATSEQIAAELPASVDIEVADRSVTSAPVSWGSVSYVSTQTTSTNFTVTGTVTLPATVKDPDNVLPNGTVTLTVYVAGAPQVRSPEASINTGTYTGSQSVTLSSATDGADIYYTTNGTKPTVGSTPYTTGTQIPVASTMTLRAYAVRSGMQDSAEAIYDYTINSPAPSVPSSGGGAATVTVPATSSAGSAQVSAAVTNGTATIAPTDEQIKTVASTTKDTGTVKVDVSSLKADTAVFPAKLVTASENAMAIKGITLALPAGSVSLDKTALDAVSKSVTESGKDVTVSVKAIDETTLTDTQKTALGSAAKDATVVNVSMLVGDTKVSSFGGGSATVTVPYTLKAGETAGSITVWYLADDGTITPMHGRYDAATKTVSFTTTHLSDYAVVSFPFTDVSEDAWYYGDVAYAYVNGLFSGTADTSFSPALDMTRGMLVTVLWRLEGKPVVNYAMHFDDVAGGEYYAEAVRWAASNQIVTGYSGTAFGPGDGVTREQLAAILYRYAQYKKYDVSIGGDTNILSYSDAFSVSEYAVSAMQWACGADLIRGSDGKLLPKDGAQRCQVAAILSRFCKNVVK